MASLFGGIGILDSALAFTGSGTATSSTYYASPGHTQVSFSLKATRAGTWRIYAVSVLDGTGIPLQASARTVTANTIDGVTLTASYGKGYYAIFTDTSGSSGTVTIAVEGEGPSLGGFGGGQTAGS